MSGPETGQPDRVASGPSTWTRRTAGALASLLVAGLALRLIIAYLLPGSGFAVDLNAFHYWAANLAEQGMRGFYDRPFFHDYTPGYLYVLWALGYVGMLIGGLGDLIKLPPILCDLVLAYLAHSMVLELGGSRRRALLAAALVLFLPNTWFDSVVWGQVDSVGVVFLLLALRATWRDQPERAALFGTIAAIVKPQLGIVIPIVAAVVIRRALFPSGTDAAADATVAPGRADEASAGNPLDRVRAWSRREHGPIRIVTTTAVGVLTASLICVPFGLSLVGLAQQVLSTAAGYPYITVNAYNPWALVSQKGAGLAANGAWLCDIAGPGRCPDPVLLGPVPAVVVGSLLMIALTVGVALIVARRPDPRTILVGLAVLAIAFFVVPTRVHERYLYPFIAVGAILAAVSLRWRIAYVALVLANFLNLYVVLTTLYPNNPSISDWLGIGGAIRSPGGVALIALVHLGGFLWAVAQLRSSSRRTLAREVAAAGGSDEETGSGGSRSGAAPAIPRPGAPGLGAPLRAASARAPGGAPQRGPRPSAATTGAVARAVGSEAGASAPGDAKGRGAAVPGGPPAPWPAAPERGLLASIRERIMARPVRADRSRGLHGEGGGRFDRLDVWLLVVLVVATSIFRFYRLAEPYQMHFDEVYHARTATEFLQKWRYGEDPPTIYEYTHPHVAKYAMAAGIVLFGGDRVAATSQLGVPVRDATIEGRWDDRSMPGGRAGDRLYVATGSEVRAYDLSTRALVATIPAAGAQALSVDLVGHRLLIGTSAGAVLALDTEAALDPLRSGRSPDEPLTPVPFASIGAPVTHLLATSDGSGLLAMAGDTLVALDGATGTERGRQTVAGLAAVVEAGSADALVARPTEIGDPAAAASTLAGLVGGTASGYRSLLTSGLPEVTIPVRLEGTLKTTVQAAIGDGRLAGFAVETRPRVAAAGRAGLTFVSTADAAVTGLVTLGAPATGLAQVTGVDEPSLYVAEGRRVAIVRIGATSAAAPHLDSTIEMPGPVSWVAFDQASRMVHVLGERSDGSGQTVYVIEPHGNAVYADAALPWPASTWAMDQAPQYPSADRQQLLVFAADGGSASIDIGGHALAWRIPGVVAGILTAALLYLLVRLLFRRRSVAVAVAVAVAIDPLLFVQSRIGMNDVYAGLFIIAAVTLFAALWTGAWRWRGAFWVAMPAVGVLLGLALASKWVGAYAIGAVGVLYLARSALGRLVLLVALVAITTILGYIGVSVPAGETGGGNLAFMVVMIALTLAAFVVAVLRPVAWSDDEIRFAVGFPAAVGILLFLAAVAAGKAETSVTVGRLELPVLSLAFALVALGGLVYLAFLVAGRLGIGPFAPPPAADDPARLLPPASPPPPGWLRPGWLLGLPLLWFAVSLIAVPLVVYVVSYIPWAFVDGHQLWSTFRLPIVGTVASWPPGHTGQTLLDLTGAMYDYHDKLRATHPASSPWWAWPFDLKPVWFYAGSFDGSTSAAIYDHGSIVTWWLSIPAMGFVALQAFRRRSLALGLVAIVFACMWIPWARIDRVVFQYHWYSSLPFMLIALGYFVAELWHGPSWRTWLLARVAAATAVMGPVILWLLKAPLCTFAGVARVYANSPACVGNPGQIVVTARVAGIAAVTIAGTALLVWQLIHLDRPAADGRVDPSIGLRPIALTALLSAVALTAFSALLPEAVIFSLAAFPSELVAILIGIPLAAIAWVVLTARDGRRFAAGLLIAAVGWTIVLYPNIAALPLPTTVFNAYQGILPTYLYPFQFAVNTEPAVNPPPIFAPEPAILFGAILLTGVIVAYSAYVWRLSVLEREADAAERPGMTGEAPSGSA